MHAKNKQNFLNKKIFVYNALFGFLNKDQMCLVLLASVLFNKLHNKQKKIYNKINIYYLFLKLKKNIYLNLHLFWLKLKLKVNLFYLLIKKF